MLDLSKPSSLSSVLKYPGVRGSAPGSGQQAPAPDFAPPFPQSAPYEAAARACGSEVARLDLGCGTALVLRRGPMQLVSRGPVWDAGIPDADKRRALRRLACWPGVTVATLPEPLAGLGLIPLVTPLHHAIWTLGPDLGAGMDRQWRHRLRQSEGARLSIRRVSGSGRMPLLRELVRIEAGQRRTRGYRAHPGAFTLALPMDALRFWDWRSEGKLCAAMVFVRHGAGASYHVSWASPEARRAGVHRVMLTRAAEALRAEGVRWLDLGSVNDEEAPGLAHFKLGTGATLVRLGPTCLVLPG